MKQVNIHEAKTHLSRLVEAAARGESFVIAKAGRPMVKVVPVEAAERPDPSRRFGFMRGQGTIPDDFDRWMQDEIIEMFEESARRLDRQLAGAPDDEPAGGEADSAADSDADSDAGAAPPAGGGR